MNTICFSIISFLLVGLLCSDIIKTPMIKDNKKFIIFCIILFYINHGYKTNFELEKEPCGAWCQRVRIN